MKRYIKSAVEPLYTLTEWVNNFDGPLNAYIYIVTGRYHSDVAYSGYECRRVFVTLREVINNPDKYPDEYVLNVKDWYVVDVDRTEEKDFYMLYLDPN